MGKSSIILAIYCKVIMYFFSIISVLKDINQMGIKINSLFPSICMMWIEMDWRDVHSFILELLLRKISGGQRITVYTRTIKSASCPDAIRTAQSSKQG